MIPVFKSEIRNLKSEILYIVPMRLRRFYHYGLFLLLLAVLLAFLVWPILLTVRGGFTTPSGDFTLYYLKTVFADPVWVAGLLNSLLIALCTTALCIVVTLPLALLCAIGDFPGQKLATALVLVPLILPPFVGAIGMRAILGRFGALNSLLDSVGLLGASYHGSL